MNLHRKRFPCQHCGRLMQSRLALIRHERSHSKEKPFTCRNCNYSSKERDELAKHYLSCIPNLLKDSNYPFQCATCNKRLRNVRALQKHRNVHSDRFRCEVCGKGNSCLSELRRHAQRHTKETTFRCHKCEYRTSRREDVVKHVKICARKNGSSGLVIMKRGIQPVNNLEEPRPFQTFRQIVREEEEDFMGDYIEQEFEPMHELSLPSSFEGVFEVKVEVDDFVPIRESSVPSFETPTQVRYLSPSQFFAQTSTFKNEYQPKLLGEVEPFRQELMKSGVRFEEAKHAKPVGNLIFEKPPTKNPKHYEDLYARIDKLCKLNGSLAKGLKRDNEDLKEQMEQLKRKNQKLVQAQMDTIDGFTKMSKKFDSLDEELRALKKPTSL